MYERQTLTLEPMRGMKNECTLPVEKLKEETNS
jgi:hypothetical protein